MFTTTLLSAPEYPTIERTASTMAVLMLWESPSRLTSHAGIIERPPSIVLHPHQADPGTGIICLAALGFAYRACEAAFVPADDWASATLLETTDLSQPCLELTSGRTLNLFTIGWAARSGAIRFVRRSADPTGASRQ